MKSKLMTLTLATTVGAVAAPAALAAETLEPVDKYFFSLGAYRASNDVKLRWEPTTGSIPGSHIDVKRDLGLDLDGTEGFFEAGASFGHGSRSGHRHKFELFRYGYNAQSSLLLTDDFQIGDDLFVEGADFEGDLDITLLGASYTWFFHHGDQSAFGIGMGAIRYEVSAALAAAAMVNGEVEAVSAGISESNWVPQIHAEYVKSLSRHWRVGVDASFVKKSGGGFSGEAIDLGAKVDYFPWQNFGFSLRYNYNDINLEFDKSRFNGAIDIKTHGPQLMATLRF